MITVRPTLQSSQCYHYHQYKTIVILCIALLSYSNALISQQCLGTDTIRRLQSTTTLTPSVYQEDVTKTTTTSELPPVLKEIVDERREYELNLGKAMDTLRKDYPELLRRKPDYSIYHEYIKVTDPSGVQTNGLSNYKNSIRFLQSLIGILYNMDRSRIQNRMIYDFSRSSIRVTWNAVLVPKVVGNERNSLYVDGVSVYNLNGKGEIIEHRFEKLMINNNPVVPPYNVFLSMTEGLMSNPNDGLIPVGLGA